MFRKFSILLTIVSLYICYAAQVDETPITKLPDGIPSCRDDPSTVQECIRNAFNIMLKKSRNGIPELNIPPIEPLEQDKIKLVFSNDVIRGKAIVRHIKVYGLSDSTVKKVEYKRNGKDIIMNIQMYSPKIELIADYRAEIFVNNAKLSSKGDFNITLVDLDSNVERSAELYERNNQTFARVTTADFQPTVGNMYISATGLAPEPALNDALLEVINSNWRSMAPSVLPALQKTTEPIVLKQLNDIFARIPMSLMLQGIE